METQNLFSPTGRVVYTIELLNAILSFLAPKDVTACARVCRSWVEVSLDYIWADVPGFKPLFEVLAPLTFPVDYSDMETDEPLVFSRPITMRDWRRLIPLLRRVKSFTIGQFDGVGRNHMYLDDSVFEKVLVTRPSTTFLPNLRKLLIKPQGRNFDRAEQFLVVLSESVVDMEFFVLRSPSVVENLAYFMLEAAERAPNVRHIAFCDGCPQPVLTNVLQEVFPKFTSLQTISLSSCAINSTVISVLSTLPSLEVIHHRWWGTNGRLNDVLDIHDAVLRADNGPPFPKLRSFALQSQLPSIIKFLSERFNPSNLQRLTIDVISTLTASNLSKLLQILAHTCKSLGLLQITQHEDLRAAPGDAITVNVLRHLKDLPLLQSMTLDYSQHLAISNQDLAEIILSCRKLTSFRLRRDPLRFGDEPSLTLELLSVLADSGIRTKLTELWVDINAKHPPSPRPINSQTLRLKKLFFGFSVALPEDVSRIAAYLDSVLNKMVPSRLLTDTTPLLSARRSELINSSSARNLVDRAALWKSVSDSLELVMATRRRTEEETRLLQEKVATLGKELGEVKQKLADVTTQDRSLTGANSSIEVLDDSDVASGLQGQGALASQPNDAA